ncbi:GNAT family N-acetyltransferase [Arthrobacter sp. B3I4]|uniref:GNAT family N-acetyltransferase n=1 Tax=Arthrobacter sp. B3I4 TaxID=3042267 RepID=UPI00278A3E17|nr:GNAT family N-acetyltransferase [Arthrobacter sp. B3I4]MDQ0756016.1 GNAT superfamily N-acetyltransferase [Arthrobacter sp. B3I4]
MALLLIRRASPEDLAGLPALEAAADRLLAAELGCPLPAAPEPDDAEEPLFLLVAGSPAVGYARVDNVGGQAHLEQLSVHPDFARRGIGRSLVEAALAAARGLGFDWMTLRTYADIPFNAPFYASCGFETVAVPTGALAALRTREAQRGLDGLGVRIAMRIRL